MNEVLSPADRAMVEDIRRHGKDRPTLPVGTQMASDLTDLFDRRHGISEESRTIGRRIAELKQARIAAERRNARAQATSLVTGSDPEGIESIGAIDYTLEDLNSRRQGIPLALDDLTRQTDGLRRQNGIAYDAELVARQRVERQNVLDAIDGLEAAWRSLADLAAARAWLANEQSAAIGRPTLPVFTFASRTPALSEVLGQMRIDLTTPEREPRPTKTADGNDVTGWNALQNSFAVGDLRQRTANDELRAAHAEDRRKAQETSANAVKRPVVTGRRGQTRHVKAD